MKILLIVLKNGMLLPFRLGDDASDEFALATVEEGEMGIWFRGRHAKTNEEMSVRISEIVFMQVTNEESLQGGSIITPTRGGRLH